MWLIVTALAALIVTAAYLFVSDGFKLNLLMAALWGLTACIFVDHAMGFLMEGGEFLEISAEALILSITMLIPVFAVWECYVLYSKLKAKHASGVAETATEGI